MEVMSEEACFQERSRGLTVSGMAACTKSELLQDVKHFWSSIFLVVTRARCTFFHLRTCGLPALFHFSFAQLDMSLSGAAVIFN